MAFHDGERAAQERAGIVDPEGRLGRGIRSFLPEGLVGFLEEQRMAVLATTGRGDGVWASLLAGAPGFLQQLDQHTLAIHAQAAEGDPWRENVESNPHAGVLVIDLATRRRVRINGRARVDATDALVLVVEEMFGNCPQYIQLRVPERNGDAPPPLKATAAEAKALSSRQQQQIAYSDTFFVATYNREHGADASHRGGRPGFVRVVSPTELLFPDYPGNNKFQSLGNLQLDPRAGLLFVDFSSGSTLQLSGHAEVLWDDPRMREFAGAKRLVRFTLDEVIEITRPGAPLRWRLVEYSPVNP